MSSFSLEITIRGATRRETLQPGLTRIGPVGGRGIDVEIEGASGELHIWDDPPKVVRVQGDDALVASGGSMVEEALLQDRGEFAWCGAKFRLIAPKPVLEELPPERPAAPASGSSAGGPASRPAAASSGLSAEDERSWSRIAAGILVETGLADKKVTKRWQSAVMQNEWDADACAREILAAPGTGSTTEPAFVARTARLERDLLMASFQRGIRGASRKIRGAARNSTAFFFANVVAILCYSAILLAILVLARVKYGFSMDGTIDRAIEAVTPG